jgi:CRP-like cAMP-binding protein
MSNTVISESRDRERFWTEVEALLSREQLCQRLGGLSPEELQTLLESSQAIVCEPGDVLIRKGHVSRTLYILLTGRLFVRDEGEVIAEVDEPGSILGEVAFFSASERMSDVITSSKGAKVLALSEAAIRNMIGAHGSGAAKFLLALTRGLCGKLLERSRGSQLAEQSGC